MSEFQESGRYEYNKPLRPTITIRDKWGDPTYLIHDAWNLPPYGTGSPTVEQCTVSLTMGEPGSCRLVIADPKRLIDTSKVGNGNQVWVQMRRNLDDPPINLFSGFIKSFGVIRPGKGQLKYEADCFSTQIVLQERIVNFIRTSPRRVDDPLRPFLDDPNMKTWILFKDLLERTDIIPIQGQPAIKHTHRPGLFITSDGSIDKQIDTPVSSLTEPMVEARQVADTLTELTGTVWGIDPGSPDFPDTAYLRAPSALHSGIVIKDKPNSNSEYTTSNVSYLLASTGWSFVDSIKKEDGFSNRLYSKTGSQSSLTGSNSATGETTLNGVDIAQQFTVTSAKLRDLSVIVSAKGYGDLPPTNNQCPSCTPWIPTNISVAIVNDLGNRPGNLQEHRFNIPVPFSESDVQMQVHFPRDSTFSVVKPGDKAWLIQYARGKIVFEPDGPVCGVWPKETTVSWHHDAGTGGISAQRSVCWRQDSIRTPPYTDTSTGWLVNTNGPTYSYKFFDTFTHIIMADDQDSIDRYGLTESFIDATWITDSHTMNAYLASILQYTAKPKRTYRVVQCTIPYRAIFKPGQLVSIVDSMAGLSEFRTTIGEVQEVVYDWVSDQTGVSPLGITKCSLTLTGYVDYKEDYIFQNINPTGEIIQPQPIPGLDPVLPSPPLPPPPPGVPPPTPPAPPPPSTGAEVKLSVSAITADGNDGNLPANVYDGNLTTRWSKTPLPAWIRLDMGSVKQLNYVKIAWYKGNERVTGFNIETSNDGSSWTTRFTGSSMGNTLGLEMYDFANVSCRYVRINVTSNSVATSAGNFYASINEIELWGIGSGSETPTPSPPPIGGQIGPYVSTGKQLGATTRRAVRHYDSGAPDDETIEKNTLSIPYAHYQSVYYVTIHGMEHDDNISLKLGGTHMGSGWYDHGVRIYTGKTCLGTEPEHPNTNSCIEVGASIGDVREKRVGVAAVWRKAAKHTELWTRLPGENWVKQLENTGSLGGWTVNNSGNDEAQLRIDGFIDGQDPTIDTAVVQEISPP